MSDRLRRLWAALLLPLRSRRGQLAIPSLFVIPSLFLFVYLIFETAKLSREKIRHQFAIDAAAFIEMTNYSDFLNRSAYVNGAFPQRIFHEGFHKTCIEKKNNTQGECGTQGDRLYNILYKNGAFPHNVEGEPDQELDAQPNWLIRFGGAGDGKNEVPPDLGDGKLELITMQNALDYWLSWDDAQDIYKLYVQIYQLLGQVEDSQHAVFKRLTADHNFFRKSYWLNTNDESAGADGSGGADGGAGYLPKSYDFKPKAHCIQEIMIFGNKPTNNPFQPYKIFAPASPVQMPATISDCSPSSGLFQMETIPQSDLDRLRTPQGPGSSIGLSSPGYPIFQTWGAQSLSDNYFKVNFLDHVKCPLIDGPPCVHATIAVDGGHLWPNPTPKFQTRLYP